MFSVTKHKTRVNEWLHGQKDCEPLKDKDNYVTALRLGKHKVSFSIICRISSVFKHLGHFKPHRAHQGAPVGVKRSEAAYLRVST